MDQVPANPNRRFWQKRTVRLALALAALILATRLIWGWWVARQLQAELNEVRKRGEPVAVTDVVYPFVADKDNAILVQAQAVRTMVAGVDSPRNSNLEYPDYPPYPAAWMKLAEASEKAHGPAFAMARQARQLSAVQFRQRLVSPVVAVLLPYLNDCKILANALTDGAAWAHVHGDDDEAIERIFDTLHLARSIRHDDFIVSQLVAMGIEAIACNQIQITAPGLRFDTTATTRPATREKIRQIIGQLLDDDLPKRAVRQSILTERLTWIDYGQFASRDTWFIRPLADRETIRMSQNTAILLEAAACPTWPQAEKTLSRCKRDDPLSSNGGGIWRLVAPGDDIPRYSRWFNEFGLARSAYLERHYRNIAERRATAVSLAWQLYRANHGRVPQRLEDLVPQYLPAVPADPFHEDQRPLGYAILKDKLPGGGDRPMVYFDHGRDIGPDKEPTYSWAFDKRPASQRVSQIRQYRDLSRFVPPPSKKAVYNNPQKPDAPGDEPQPEQQPDQPQPR